MADTTPPLSQSYEEIGNTPSTSSGTPELVEASTLPTESHQLANAPVDEEEEKGVAQLAHNDAAEVKDLGWNDHPDDVPSPLVGGMQNEELWTLIRRFNKVTLIPLFLVHH